MTISMGQNLSASLVTLERDINYFDKKPDTFKYLLYKKIIFACL